MAGMGERTWPSFLSAVGILMYTAVNPCLFFYPWCIEPSFSCQFKGNSFSQMGTMIGEGNFEDKKKVN